ncbi:MAG: hypothetical protein LBT97_03890 [Planctomycetota bacterium]|jgi:hypothetical protein|nr:hypothetical protein [Planctomycetota bacterium]
MSTVKSIAKISDIRQTSETFPTPKAGADNAADQAKNNIPGETGIVNPDEAFEQPAVHASPYRFDRFSLDAIGTGEGAQVHGWGVYALRGDTEDRKQHADERYRRRRSK